MKSINGFGKVKRQIVCSKVSFVNDAVMNNETSKNKI